jgi:CDP-paratose 2-epimerase
MIDVRHRHAIRDVFRTVRPDFIIHTAAQPSHDRAAALPYDDFDINAVGTLNILAASREFTKESPLCFTSTNKVYGDRPNSLPLLEAETRWRYANDFPGISEDFPIDQSLHSLFGVSKLAADLLCQEYGRYYQMPIGIFRAGCLTGANHAAVELHGYLNYIIRCAVFQVPYTIRGYKGKQVRDQLHCHDVARLFCYFYSHPRCGEVYNLGGGQENSVSILETIEVLAELGFPLTYSYDERARDGDHICYISDLRKLKCDFPRWRVEHSLGQIFGEIVDRYVSERRA